MKVFYFTSTGNCLEVAKKIGGDLYAIPQVLKEGPFEFEDEQIGIIFPTYLGSIPTIVTEFMEKVTLKTNYFFGIATYGLSAMGVLDHFQKMARKNNLEAQYLNQFVMVDNSLALFDMDAQLATIGKKNIDAAIEKVVQDILSQNEALYTSNFVLKNLSNGLYHFQVQRQKSNHKQFTVESSCTLCKTCEKVCPVDNIVVSNTPEYGTHCISCYGCAHNCPVNAIRVKGEKSKSRFRNSHVSLSEIIEANK